METIVVGYDQTEAADRALDRAATFAKAFRAKLVITSVAPILVGRGGGIDPVDPPSAHEAQLAHAQEVLSTSGVEVEVVPAVGHPAESIIQLADQVDAGMIVVGAGEHGFVERLLAGSVSGTVGRKANCDVLVVH